MYFSRLKEIINGKLVTSNEKNSFSQLSTDSRSISNPSKTLFFAIKGANHDGHKYIQELYEKGVRQFVVEYKIDISTLPEASIFVCLSSVIALQELVTHHRKQYILDVVGITGSNGKTIVKEWLYQLLSPDLTIVKSPKSYNSQVGVPLSVWQLNETHELGIFEAGISTIDEMDKLAAVIQPCYGIFTTIGSAHSQGFNSEEEKISEKLKLFNNVDRLVYCREHEAIHQAVVRSNMKGFTWGEHKEADVIINQLTKQVDKTAVIQLNYKEQPFTFHLPFNDSASIENAMHCITFMLLKNYVEQTINSRLSELHAIKMRLELKQGINNCQLIDDTYNNDLGGLRIALEFMEQQNTHFTKKVIVSDILQTGLEDDELYSQFAQMLEQHNVAELVGIGTTISKQASKFNIPSTFFDSTEVFLNQFNADDFSKELILIKGARSFSFEHIVNQLEQKIHGTVLEIDLNALSRNLNYYRSQLANTTKLMVMVKAFAYGSGSNEVANLLQHHQVDYLGVAYVDEGTTLRKSGIRLPIMVMNPSPDSFDKCIEFNLEPEVYNFNMLDALIHHLNEKPIGIHLKVDTGMRRLGFDIDDVDQLIEILKQHYNIEVKSIFTHLAGADNATHNAFSEQQINNFTQIVDRIKAALKISPIIHALNSAGILRFPQYHFDMVRLGVGLYGVESNEENQHSLAPISSLKTVVSQIKQVQKGETIGYSRKGKATADLKTATIAIGYADGYSRAFSNGIGQVYVNGQRASVIGNVCMDMTMIDVTGIDVAEGDEVEVFGKNISIMELAHQINTIPYEILTNVSNRVKRVFFLD